MAFGMQNISGDHFSQLNHFFQHDYNSGKLVEQSQKINHPAVDGQSDEWYFDGIRMGYSDWHYRKPVELKWNYDINVELVTFHANLKGAVCIGNGKQGCLHLVASIDLQHLENDH